MGSRSKGGVWRSKTHWHPDPYELHNLNHPHRFPMPPKLLPLVTNKRFHQCQSPKPRPRKKT